MFDYVNLELPALVERALPLIPEALSQACKERGIPLILRLQPDYDHSYHLIAAFIGEHLAYHARALTSRS